MAKQDAGRLLKGQADMQTAASVGLLEREAQIAQLRALLDETSKGGGRLAVIEGPGGIGKTRLLETARESAGERGMEVLAARGSELERDFPFGIVRQLFEPLLRRASPSEQRKLLQGPAQLAAPALGFEKPQAREEPPKL